MVLFHRHSGRTVCSTRLRTEDVGDRRTGSLSEGVGHVLISDPRDSCVDTVLHDWVFPPSRSRSQVGSLPYFDDSPDVSLRTGGRSEGDHKDITRRVEGVEKDYSL